MNKIDLTEKVDLSEQTALSEDMRKSDMKTTFKKMSAIISEKLDFIKDKLSMELNLDPGVRMKKRLEAIRQEGSAEHFKIQGKWTTEDPKMHIAQLVGKKISNDEYQISFSVYEVDAKGNKKLYNNYVEHELYNGEKVRRVNSAEYKVALEITETIKRGQPITRDIVEIDN